MRLLLACLLAVLSTCALPVVALADSLVFIKDGDVWRSAADGGRMAALTTDGTPSQPYRSPSQADDGTVVVQRGTRLSATLYRLDQRGAQRNPPFVVSMPGTGMVDPRVSPDGRLVAFWYITFSGSGSSTDKATGITTADRYTDPESFGYQGSVGSPSWIGGDSSRLLFSDISTSWTHDVSSGRNNYQEWFQDAGQPTDLVLDRSGTRLAAMYSQYGAIQLFAVNGTTVTTPPTPTCFEKAPGELSAPTWSPDGHAVAWSAADGVHVMDTSCAGDHLVVPGASEPAWGPADPVAAMPPPGPGVTAPPAGSPPQPGSPPPPQPARVAARARLAASLTARGALRRLRGGGLAVTVDRAPVGRTTVTLTVSRADAHRLRLVKGAPLARGTVRATSGKRVRVVLRVGAKLARRLRTSHRLAVTVSVLPARGSRLTRRVVLS